MKSYLENVSVYPFLGNLNLELYQNLVTMKGWKHENAVGSLLWCDSSNIVKAVRQLTLWIGRVFSLLLLEDFPWCLKVQLLSISHSHFQLYCSYDTNSQQWTLSTFQGTSDKEGLLPFELNFACSVSLDFSARLKSHFGFTEVGVYPSAVLWHSGSLTLKMILCFLFVEWEGHMGRNFFAIGITVLESKRRNVLELKELRITDFKLSFSS